MESGTASEPATTPTHRVLDRLRSLTERLPPVIVRSGVPLVFAVLIVATYLAPEVGGDHDNPALRPVDLWWLGAGLIGANALAFRQSHPLVMAGAVIAIVTVVGIAPYPLAPIAWMIYVASFALGRYGDGRQGAIALVWLTASVVVTWFSDQGLDGADVAFVYAFAVMVWLAGRELFRWRERVALEISTADRRVEFERRGVELALAQERLHIAQEIHDVVAHSLGVIAVQAGMASTAFDQRPEEARRAVDNIAITSRASLDEIRRILGMLRHGSDDDLAAPDLTGLPELIAGAEANGLVVDATIDLDPVAAIPAGIQSSAYRVVQQSLTNVLEHAAGSAVQLWVRNRDGVVEIEVLDDGSGGAGTDREGTDGQGGGPDPGRASGDGYGLVGMRERVATYGGELRAGPEPTGGFRVAATVPYRQDDQRP